MELIGLEPATSGARLERGKLTDDVRELAENAGDERVARAEGAQDDQWSGASWAQARGRPLPRSLTPKGEGRSRLPPQRNA
jgi:hypothetical protein